MLLKILSVAALATFEIYAAIPSGFAMGLSPWIILLASTAGGVAGVFITAFFGGRIRKFIFRNKKQQQEDHESKHPVLKHIWDKYGIIGLGVLGTMILGAPITIGVGVALNAEIKKLITWSCVGVITRCIIFTVIGYYGLKLF